MPIPPVTLHTVGEGCRERDVPDQRETIGAPKHTPCFNKDPGDTFESFIRVD